MRRGLRLHLAVLATLAMVMGLLPLVLSNPYYLNVLSIVGLNAIMVAGLTLFIGYAGQISLGHAAFYGMGAYISGVLSASYGLSPWATIPTALTITALVALLLGVPTLKLKGHYMVMATLGFNIIVSVVLVEWEGVTGGVSGFSGIPNLSLWGLVLESDRAYYYLIWGTFFLVAAGLFSMILSRTGRALKAVKDGELAAGALGVNVAGNKLMVFVLSALLAALSGCLYAHYLTFISPKTFDIFFSIELVAMVIIGGMGSIWGSVAGAAFLTPLPQLLHVFDDYKDLIYGAIFMGMLVKAPQGLAGIIGDLLADRSRTPGVEFSGQTPRESTWHPSAERENSKEELLRVNNLQKRFNGVRALQGISFTVNRGDILGMIGPNGAGKTTAVNVITGIEAPSGGKVFWKGKDITGISSHKVAREGIVRTFQHVQVFPTMSVLENILVGLHMRGSCGPVAGLLGLPRVSAEEERLMHRAWEMLSLFGIEEKANLRAGGLPYGEQRRVVMARAVAADPELLFLDEPAAGLNTQETMEMMELIVHIHSMGKTVVLIDHDMDLVMGLSHQVVVLNKGEIIAQGQPEEVQGHRGVIEAYLGADAYAA